DPTGLQAPAPRLLPRLVRTPRRLDLHGVEPGVRAEPAADLLQEGAGVLRLRQVREEPAVALLHGPAAEPDERVREELPARVALRRPHAELEPAPIRPGGTGFGGAHPPVKASFTRDQKPLCAPRFTSAGAGASISRRDSKRARCSGVSSSGVHTSTRTIWSPRERPFSSGSPSPRSRSISPLWMPDGIVTRAAPSSVGTSTPSPRAACANVIGSSWRTFDPSRSKRGSSCTSSSTTRSPRSPPRGPTLPRPRSVRKFSD